MRHHYSPEVGMWFTDLDNPSSFEVVALDESEGYVEIQHFTGEIEEIELENWFEMDLDPLPGPEDWDGPYEITAEDYDYLDENYYPEDLSGILTEWDRNKN